MSPDKAVGGWEGEFPFSLKGGICFLVPCRVFQCLTVQLFLPESRKWKMDEKRLPARLGLLLLYRVIFFSLS